MHLDVEYLQKFYFKEPLGRSVQGIIREEVLKIWPETNGQTVAGFGFTIPLLRPYLSTSRRVISLMPGPQGVIPWPSSQDNVSVLCEESIWPLETGHVDRLLILHGLETSDDQAAVLAEAFRVLGPGGRALFIVPNRVGLWSRSELTPMGYGRPYTSSQLETQLRIHGFVPELISTTLYQLPSFRQRWQRLGGMFERIGRNVPFFAGGLLIFEARKLMIPLDGSKIKNTVPKRVGIIKGLSIPKPKPI